MLTHVRMWLAERGLGTEFEITAMTPGLGHTDLWKISDASGGRDLVLRIFPPHDAVSAGREALAMQAVGDHGLPVPAVIAIDVIGDRPALLTTFAPGETVAATLAAAHAGEIGRQLGVLLGRLHDIPAPDGLAPPERWIERAGPALAPLHDWLRELPSADQLLHLDYHPENVMMRDGEVTAIIDWTNTLPGPPHIDLGRSRAILQMVRSLPRVSAERATAVERFEEGLVTGHASVQGDDPQPALSLAWGVGMVVVDLGPQVGKLGSWVTQELAHALEEKRDRLIESLVAG